MKHKIVFNNENIDFQLNKSNEIRNWLTDVLSSKSFQPSLINYIFCSDEYLLNINISFLNHDFYTDIITFPYNTSSDGLVSDIFISIDRVRENAKDLEVSFDDELHRVMVHGILHLIGYDDHSDEDETEMRRMEDYYLNLRPKDFQS